MARSHHERRLIFVQGKGGVGKTVVSQALAHALAHQGRRTLWMTFEDPTRPPGELRHPTADLTELNADAQLAFEEYITLKIGAPRLAKVFLHNKVIRYLAQAAPGIHELVLLGKVWHERENYDHVVADMPSTGYGLAMFQSVRNFAELFRGGPIHRDAEAMLATFRDPDQTGQLIVSLPEEMPLRESLELDDQLRKFFPDNSNGFLVNRRFPSLAHRSDESPEQWASPVASDILDYARKRAILEERNLHIWRDRGIRFGELPFIPPAERNAHEGIIGSLSRMILPALKGGTG